MAKSVLHVWLPPVNKIYPLGVVNLANHIHIKKPKVLQHILDLSTVPIKERSVVLNSTIRGFEPDVICFSWRDIQIFAPHQEDSSLDFALDFFVFNGLFSWIKASFSGLFALNKYNSKIKENLKYINDTAENFSNITILLGGGAFSVFADQLVDRLHSNVTGVIGEGENLVIKILEERSIEDERYVSSEKKSSNLKLNSSTLSIFDNMVDLPYISKIFKQHTEYKDETIGIQTKRGCGSACQFCIYPYIEGSRVRLKDPKAVVQNILSYYKYWGSRKFWFADAQFIPGKNYIPHCEDILEALFIEKLDIEWSGYIRTDLITPTLADLMVATGLGNLEVSITSGSQRIIDDLNLGFKLENLYQGCRFLNEAGYRKNLVLNYSLNSPGADEDSVRESIVSYNKIVEIMGEDQVVPFIFFLGIQPNTMMEKRLIKSGYLDVGYNPLSLDPKNASKLLYNPPPLNKLLSKAYHSTKHLPANEKGKGVFKYLEQKLM